MEKAYLCLDKEENIFLGVVKAETNSKAKQICARAWMKTWGLDFIEACNSIYCSRYKALDNYKFDYFDGRDISEELESITTEDIVKELEKLLSKN